ncbi:MAG: TIGR02221 family CRISPR-associated protein [Thermogemmata sp.]
MATTLISFLGVGRKRDPHNPRSQYEQTTYRFDPPPSSPGSSFTRATSLFGLALLDYLINGLQKKVERWIILGTNASLWSELYRLLDNSVQNQLEEEYIRIDDHVISKTINQDILTHWESLINQYGVDKQPQVSLHLIEPFDQERLAEVLLKAVPEKSEVVLDISHGFRHLPTLATHVLTLMRWTHDIRSVSYYSGVFEARDALNQTPVACLSFCQELQGLTEAMAVFHLTGNYQQLLQQFLQNEEDQQLAEQVWFLENTNQLSRARTQIQDLIDRLSQSRHASPALTAIIQQQLRNFLSSRHYDDEWYYANAQEALKHQNYLHAIILTYEAILIRTCRLVFGYKSTSRYDSRKNAEEYLFNYAGLNEEYKTTLRQVQWVRNACSHGTSPERADPAVEAALDEPSRFCKLLRLSWNLYRALPQLLPRRP